MVSDPPFRVLLTDRAWPSLDLERDILSQGNAELIEAPDDSEQTLIGLASDVDAIATCWAKVTSRVIEAAPKCRIIARLGIGLDNIDVQAATAKKIPVTNVPDYCIPEVADHTIGLLLGLARKIAYFDHEAKQQRYDLRAAGPIYRLKGKTLGLLGFGRIARAVRTRAMSFGLNVVAHSASDDDYQTGCEMVTWDDLLSRSDYLSLHAPLTDQTRHLFDTRAFQAVKPGVFLVNTSRGGLIDQAALWQAIQDGTVAAAGLDVFEPEPPDLSNPLFQDQRVIITPHAAFTSEESLIDLRTRVCHQILLALDDSTPENLVNPEIYD
jgi:D-3-phosphoglycerate dehydrogenase